MPQYNIGFDFTQPTQIVFTAQLATAGRPVFNQLISNRDPAVTVLLGFETGRQVPDFTAPLATSILDPLSSTVVDGTVNVWAVAVNPNAPGLPNNAGPANAATPPAQASALVDVVPTSLSSSGNPVAIATAIVQSGLALAIAQQISQNGISLVGSPKLVYNVLAPPGPPGTPGAWGASVFGAGTEAQTIQEFQNFTGRPVTCNRVYINSPGQVFTSTSQFPNDLAAASALGLTAVISFQPTFKGTNGPNNLPTAAQLQADQTSMVNCLNSIIALGIPAARLRVTMWHEPENPSKGISAAQYLNLYNGVASGGLTNYAALHAICPVYHIALADEVTGSKNIQYLPFTPTLGSNFADGFLADYYGSFYTSASPPTKVLPTYAAMADNAVPPLPFGLGEFGSNAGGTALTTAQNALWLLAESITIGGTTYPGDPVNSVEAVFGARLAAGKKNLETMWFASYTAPGPNAITSASDVRIPMLQRLHNTLAGSGASPGTIAAGATVTFSPLIPSAVAAYAIADGLSYDITVSTTTTIGSTNPWVTVTLSWFNQDSPTAAPVDVQSWVLPIGNRFGTAVITGRGPQRGQFLQAQITNLDTVACTVGMQLNSTSRSAPRDDWRWDQVASTGIPTFLSAGGPANSLCLGAFNGKSLAPAATNSWLFSMFAGEVFARFNVSGAAGVNTVHFTLTPQPASVFSAENIHSTWLPLGAANGQNESELTLVLARGVYLLTVFNGDANTVTVSAVIDALEQ